MKLQMKLHVEGLLVLLEEFVLILDPGLMLKSVLMLKSILELLLMLEQVLMLEPVLMSELLLMLEQFLMLEPVLRSEHVLILEPVLMFEPVLMLERQTCFFARARGLMSCDVKCGCVRRGVLLQRGLVKGNGSTVRTVDIGARDGINNESTQTFSQ